MIFYASSRSRTMKSPQSTKTSTEVVSCQLSVDRCQELEAGLTADRVKPVTWGSLHARETLLFFQPTVNCILNVINHNPDIPFNNLNSKIIDNVFISEITVLPKIFTNNLLPNPKLSLSYLVSPFINPPTKEQLFLTLSFISLLCSDYKIQSKVLSNRLSSVRRRWLSRTPDGRQFSWRSEFADENCI